MLNILNNLASIHSPCLANNFSYSYSKGDFTSRGIVMPFDKHDIDNIPSSWMILSALSFAGRCGRNIF
jgi:hypothetical protein